MSTQVTARVLTFNAHFLQINQEVSGLNKLPCENRYCASAPAFLGRAL